MPKDLGSDGTKIPKRVMDLPNALISTSNSTVSDVDRRISDRISIEKFLELVECIPPSKPKYVTLEENSTDRLRMRISIELDTHFKKMGYIPAEDGIAELEDIRKQRLREMQLSKRQEQLVKKREFILKKSENLLEYIADGTEIVPEKITPKIVVAQSGTLENDLFHFLSFYWSVPVSNGYGRRMRFLVTDEQNGKAIGIFGLTDPVFNLRVRDNWVDWTVEQRKDNLRSVLDAYVLGAVPPYSNLLGGKLICTLLTSTEVREEYTSKYSAMKSVISKRIHDNNLLLLTTTSALGKSSLYDRVKIGPRKFFQSVGVTEGYGHFHIPQTIFNKMRHLLTLIDHPYAKNNRFGHGPNWRMRVIRVALKECGFNSRLLKHQIKRESFMIPLAENTKECLRGEQNTPQYFDGTIESISEQAKKRWIIPRSIRKPSYKQFRREEFLSQIVRMLKPESSL